MAKGRKKSSRSHNAVQDLAAVVFADTLEEANEYKALLRENDIYAVVKPTTRTPDSRTFAVMVPEDCLDEAHVIIESQHGYGDFCQYSLDDEPDDFPEGVFDDEGF